MVKRENKKKFHGLDYTALLVSFSPERKDTSLHLSLPRKAKGYIKDCTKTDNYVKEGFLSLINIFNT
jgi:hypothetical protein